MGDRLVWHLAYNRLVDVLNDIITSSRDVQILENAFVINTEAILLGEGIKIHACSLV